MRRLRVVFAVLLLWGAARPAAAATRVEAQLGSTHMEAGGSVTLTVTISDPSGGTGDPRLELPAGLSVLGTDRVQNFSFVNGRASSTIEFRYELGAEQPGSYAIPPIRVRVGNQDFECAAQHLLVTTPAPRPRPAPGSSPATLSLHVEPARPYVGQLVQLTLRLSYTTDLERQGPNSSPSTAGFWSESWGEPVDYSTRAGGRMANVVERRLRIYPLAAGRTTIGPSTMLVAPAVTNIDPFFGGVSTPSRPIELNSDTLSVAVAPLPGGAPVSFENAVGSFRVNWSLDRGHAAQDQAITLMLDVRGVGNLPLLHAPVLDLPAFDVFASAIDDSFASPGEVSPGRRRFRWTLLPRRSGTLSVEGIPFAWFDPQARAYRDTRLPALSVEVLPAGAGADRSAADDAFPPALARADATPGGHGARPWVFVLAGLLLGLAVRAWRRGGAADPGLIDRAQTREYLRVVGLANGPDFWRAADEATSWLERRGAQVLRLREDIERARYSGAGASENDVRRRLVERLAAGMPPASGAGAQRWLALGLAGAAVALWLLGSPGHGSDALTARVAEADAHARAHHLAQSESQWRAAWADAPGNPALAARLAWAALRGGRLAEASAWVLRGRAGEARDGALAWSEARIREAGGLVGAPGGPVPIRSLEWAALAFALALGSVLEWPRRPAAAALLALALACAAVPAAQRLAQARSVLAVATRTTPLAGADVDLDPGQVVRVLAPQGARVRVRAGRELEGWVAADALLHISGPVR